MIIIAFLTSWKGIAALTVFFGIGVAPNVFDKRTYPIKYEIDYDGGKVFYKDEKNKRIISSLDGKIGSFLITDNEVWLAENGDTTLCYEIALRNKDVFTLKDGTILDVSGEHNGKLVFKHKKRKEKVIFNVTDLRETFSDTLFVED